MVRVIGGRSPGFIALFEEVILGLKKYHSGQGHLGRVSWVQTPLPHLKHVYKFKVSGTHLVIG